MALIECPECSKQISDQSEKCINCGYPIKKNVVGVEDATNGSVPFFSNKEKANTNKGIFAVCASLFAVCGVLIAGPIKYVIGCAVIATTLFVLCSGVFSYVEIISDTVTGQSKKGIKFELKIQEITNVTRVEKELTIYTKTTEYIVNCGDRGEAIVDYINNVKSGT